MNHPHRQRGKARTGLIVAASGVVVLVVAALLMNRPPQTPAGRLQTQAETFVELGLSLAQQHAKEVDAYFGPAELDLRGDGKGPSLEELTASARSLLDEVAADQAQEPSERRRRLQAQIGSFGELLAIIEAPKSKSFDEEARAIYGIEPVAVDAAQPKEILKTLDDMLPGQGTLAFRVASFRNQFVVPADKRKAVFERALEECRTRTLANWKLPANEQLTVEWSRKVDAAWHRYEGNNRSTLQLNPLAVAFLGSAIDVACHEGYPGHHAQFVVMEADAGEQGLAVENQMVLLRSPVSVLREGAANYGVDLVFPPGERLVFERDVLFPMAGFAPAQAEKYAQVHRLIGELALSVVPTLRDYRDGTLPFNSATFQLEREALISSPGSLLEFVDDFGAYVIGYTVARDQVRAYIDAQSLQSGEDHWTVLRRVLAQADVSVLNARPAQQPPADRSASSATASNLHESKA